LNLEAVAKLAFLKDGKRDC